LFIADIVPKHLDQIQQLDTEYFDFITFYKNIKKLHNNHYVLLTNNPKKLLKKIKRSCTIIKAAGGLVENANGQFLFIFRNKKWDLPKGKVEKDEKMKITAVREVEEECGVTIEKREDLLCKTYHVYELGTKIVLKKTNWYKMLVKGSPKLIPQVEEGITNAVWVAPIGIEDKIQNTYPLILDVLAAENLV